MRHHHFRTGLAIACLLATVSCLEREEEIVVAPDGSVRVTHTVSGQGADLDGGEASVPSGPEYTIVRTVEKAGTDDEKTVLVATARFAKAAEMPDRFEDPAAEHFDASLRFPTDLRVIDRPDGRHFILTRRYLPREWARFQFHHRRAFPEDVLALLERGSGDDLSDDERRTVLVALARYEQGKHEEWLRDAVLASIPDDGRRTLAFHAGRAALEEFFAANAAPEQLEALLAMTPEEIERASRELEDALDLAILDAVAAAFPEELAGDSEERFLSAYAGARRATHVTEDLEDESFVVRIRLPGRVIAHNADAIEDGVAVWRFDGKDLRDREQRIELHSVAP